MPQWRGRSGPTAGRRCASTPHSSPGFGLLYLFTRTGKSSGTANSREVFPCHGMYDDLCLLGLLRSEPLSRYHPAPLFLCSAHHLQRLKYLDEHTNIPARLRFEFFLFCKSASLLIKPLFQRYGFTRNNRRTRGGRANGYES